MKGGRKEERKERGEGMKGKKDERKKKGSKKKQHKRLKEGRKEKGRKKRKKEERSLALIRNLIKILLSTKKSTLTSLLLHLPNNTRCSILNIA